MKPVDQTTFGAPKGNCFAACVATIFGLPIDAVPHFMEEPDWWSAFRSWLHQELDYDALFIPLSSINGAEWLRDIVAPCIVSGPADRGLDHATVWDRGAPFHDPHPSRSGLLKINDAIVFMPLRPSLGAAP